ncbi:MAG: hypothetical protein ACR2OF_06935, partial [Hyphomicrobium sp.]
ASSPANAPKASASGPTVPDARQEPAKSEPSKSSAPGATATAAKDKPAPGPKSEPKAAVGFGGFLMSGVFTHLAAGLAGGIVALLAADLLATQLRLSRGQQSETTRVLQQRISALEAKTNQETEAPELASKLAAAEARLGKLETLGKRVEELTNAQGKLAKDVTAITKTLGTQGDAGKTQERIAKLEAQLEALSAVAEQDPQAGRLPQLAAVTGKIADLESMLNNQLDALRRSVNAEIDKRLSAVSAASEAAKSGTQRIDRELAALKTEEAQLNTRLNSLKTENDRTVASLQKMQEEIAALKTNLDIRLKSFARPSDVSSAVTPLTDRLTALESNVQSVMKSEEDRKAIAERIVLSLELGNLKRAIDRGESYASELAEARKLSDGRVDLAPLERFEDKGVPTLAELRQDFKAVAFKMIDAEMEPAEGSIVDYLLAGARTVVRWRKISHSPDDASVEAIVGRMEIALNEDRLSEVLDVAKSLPPPAADAVQDFLAKVEARNAVDKALAAVEMQLKASLSNAESAPETDSK